MALIDVPQPGQTLGATQAPIRANFLSINNAFQVDHVAYNLTGAGLHKQISFQLQSAAPTFGGLNGLWSQVYTGVTNIAEIWVNSLNGNQYPMTASILSNTPAIGNNTNGWTYLPSGILMKWGFIAVAAAPFLTNVDLNAIGPNFGATFSAQATPTGFITALNVALVPSTLQISSTIAASCYWFVIGRE